MMRSSGINRYDQGFSPHSVACSWLPYSTSRRLAPWPRRPGRWVADYIAANPDLLEAGFGVSREGGFGFIVVGCGGFKTCCSLTGRVVVGLHEIHYLGGRASGCCLHQARRRRVINVLGDCPVLYALDHFVDNKKRNEEPLARSDRIAKAIPDFNIQLR